MMALEIHGRVGTPSEVVVVVVGRLRRWVKILAK